MDFSAGLRTQRTMTKRSKKFQTPVTPIIKMRAKMRMRMKTRASISSGIDDTSTYVNGPKKDDGPVGFMNNCG